MIVHSFFQLFVLLLIEGYLFSEGVLIFSNQVLGFHEGILLHLIYLQLLQRNIHAFPLELSPQELILLLQLIDDPPLEDLVCPLVLGLELEIVVLEDHSGFVVRNLLIDILHFLVGRHFHLLDDAVLVVFVFLLGRFQLVFEGLDLALELSDLALFGFVLRLELDELLIALSKVRYFAVLFTLVAFQLLLFAVDLLGEDFHPSGVLSFERFVLFVPSQYHIDFLLELVDS